MVTYGQMHERNKWAFWTLMTAGLLVICVPSSILLDALRGYERFLSGVEPGTIRPVRMRSVPHAGRADDEKKLEPRLQFVDFRLKAPKARKVCLVGDFNHWKPDTLPLAKLPGGTWELTMPLPRGRYLYRFWVDGQERADPENKKTAEADGRPASVKELK